MKTLMKSSVSRLIFSALLVFSGNLSYSQQPWTLEQCIAYALENNIQIKQQQINTLVNENNFEQSRLDLLPDINANGNTSVSYGRALDETTYEFTDDQRVVTLNTSIGANVTLFNGLRQLNNIKLNRYSWQQSLEELQTLRNNVSLNVASAYLQILFNIELLEIAREQVALSQKQVERTTSLVEAGSLPQGNKMEIEAQLANDELQEVSAQNQLDMAYLNLSQLLNMDSVDNFKIAQPAVEITDNEKLPPSVSIVYNAAVQQLPEIRASEFNKEIAKTNLSLARGGRSPRVFASASYGTGYSDIRRKIIGFDTLARETITTDYPLTEQFKDNASFVYTVGINIPIFSGWSVETNIKNAKLGFENANYELENTKLQLYQEIQQAYLDAAAAYKKYTASGRALEAMNESFKYTQQRFDVGLINAVEYQTATTQLTQTESDLLQAKYDYIFKMKILDFYQGKPIIFE